MPYCLLNVSLFHQLAYLIQLREFIRLIQTIISRVFESLEGFIEDVCVCVCVCVCLKLWL